MIIFVALSFENIPPYTCAINFEDEKGVTNDAQVFNHAARQTFLTFSYLEVLSFAQ
jgi:hypothetical protein